MRSRWMDYKIIAVVLLVLCISSGALTDEIGRKPLRSSVAISVLNQFPEVRFSVTLEEYHRAPPWPWQQFKVERPARICPTPGTSLLYVSLQPVADGWAGDEKYLWEDKPVSDVPFFGETEYCTLTLRRPIANHECLPNIAKLHLIRAEDSSADPALGIDRRVVNLVVLEDPPEDDDPFTIYDDRRFPGLMSGITCHKTGGEKALSDLEWVQGFFPSFSASYQSGAIRYPAPQGEVRDTKQSVHSSNENVEESGDRSQDGAGVK